MITLIIAVVVGVGLGYGFRGLIHKEIASISVSTAVTNAVAALEAEIAKLGPAVTSEIKTLLAQLKAALGL